MIKITKIVNGYLDENCYLIEGRDSILIVDPGSESEKIISKIKEINKEVKAILITHYHFDHIGALDELKNKYDVNVIDYNSKQNVNIDDMNFKVIKCYGHTLDSVMFYFYDDKIIFTGDFVFKGTIGIYDKENEQTMFESLSMIKDFDKDIVLYPGHGMQTTIGFELKNNPFLRGI